MSLFVYEAKKKKKRIYQVCSEHQNEKHRLDSEKLCEVWEDSLSWRFNFIMLYCWELDCVTEFANNCTIKSTIFWDITRCSPLNVNRSFGGTYRLHLQNRRISQARNQRGSRWEAELWEPQTLQPHYYYLTASINIKYNFHKLLILGF
jgi:hypothetical protein